MNFINNRFYRRILPRLLTIITLLVIFLVYSYFILHQEIQLVGHGDVGRRFQIAMEYAEDPSKALNIRSWLGVWPPIPFIIQGFILRLILFPGMSNAHMGIITVELTSVVLTLLGFYFISRTVALQTNEFTGLLACLMCFCASIMLYLAHTGLGEVYTFFFISFAIYNLFRFINQGKGLSWSVLSFALAFFCRSESLLLALLSGVMLVAYRRWFPGIILVGTTVFLAISKLLLTLLLVDQGTKFFEHGKKGGFAEVNTWRTAFSFLVQLGHHNKEFILLFFICIVPLFYLILKPSTWNSLTKRKVENKQHNRNDNSPELSYPIRAKRIGWLALFANTYRQISLWIVRFPIIFWAACFIVSIGILLEEAIRGNIDAQWRYLFIANVFMTTVISLIAAQIIRFFYLRKSKLARQTAFGITTMLILFSLWSGLAHATGQKAVWKMSSPEKEVIQFINDHSVQGDRLAFGYLPWDKVNNLAVYLLNPSLEPLNQFSYTHHS